jgi:LysR family glycine cleavage system transcriptional activator
VPDLPPLASLRAFESAARHLSFRAAADELSVTQSAISHQVAELERRLGAKLFERHNRRVALTPAGEQYHPYLREAFDRIAQGTALVRAAGAPSRELDVQVYVTVAVRWLIPRLHSFTTAHPEVRVRFNTSHLDWEFDETAGDVAIVCTARPERPGLHATHLFDAQLTPVCSPSVLHGGIGMRQPADLVNHALLQLYTAADEWSVWLRACRPIRQSGPASTVACCGEAIDGQGVAIAPLPGRCRRGGRWLLSFVLQVPQPRRWWCAATTPRRSGSPPSATGSTEIAAFDPPLPLP